MVYFLNSKYNLYKISKTLIDKFNKLQIDLFKIEEKISNDIQQMYKNSTSPTVYELKISYGDRLKNKDFDKLNKILNVRGMIFVGSMIGDKINLFKPIGEYNKNN